VNRAFRDINTAYRWNKPALFSSYRVNFVSEIEEGNRTQGLFSLRDLLKQIIKKWPDPEFMTSSDLGHFIANSK
jgi:hypothetical protein